MAYKTSKKRRDQINTSQKKYREQKRSEGYKRIDIYLTNEEKEIATTLLEKYREGEVSCQLT